ncbi:unnamed protein product [Litomosoides sigmodontis]|uniref:Uncharacterized protein n=1 Tax=Litomosoides sigmodontis TaxID=42156 RepID=A0A3P6TQ99_LITSI|nr:unnamed protein product [Litomosoides sigmodontis]
MVLITAGATGDKGAVNRNYRRYSRRQMQSASNHGLVYKRLSSSAAEVQLPHSDDDDDGKYSLNSFHGNGILESTHSLTYLEWVHERQTRRMRTRSEWFLLPVPSAKDSDTSQLNASVLSATSMLQPCSQCDSSTMGSFDGCTGTAENTDECFVNAIQKLRSSETCEETATLSLGNISGQLPSASQPSTSSTSWIAGGIVRRRSWRTHYVRPNRIVEGRTKERNPSEVAVASSRSAPLYRRNVPHASSRSFPSLGLSIMPSSSLVELEQQRQRSRAPSPECKKSYPSTTSSNSTSHERRSMTISRSKNAHF